MKQWRRWAALLLCALLTAALLPGCGQPDETVTFAAALEGAPATYDPAMAVSAVEQTAAMHLFENLMRLHNGDNGIEVEGAVAQSWECTDNMDGTETYTFRLRNDARWSDGKEVRAQDFVYGWQHLVDPATESPNAAMLDMVAGYDKARKGDLDALAVMAVNDTTLQVDLSCRCPYFLRTLQLSEHYYDTRRVGPDVLKLYFCASAEEAQTLLDDGTVDFAGNLADEALIGAEGWTAASAPRVTLLVVNQGSRQLSGYGVLEAMSLAIDRTALAQLPGAGPRQPAEGLIPYGVVTSAGERTHRQHRL